MLHILNKTYITEALRQAITKRSKCNNKANKTKLPTDVRNYKKQRRYVVNLIKRQNLNILADIIVQTVNLFE